MNAGRSTGLSAASEGQQRADSALRVEAAKLATAILGVPPHRNLDNLETLETTLVTWGILYEYIVQVIQGVPSGTALHVVTNGKYGAAPATRPSETPSAGSAR